MGFLSKYGKRGKTAIKGGKEERETTELYSGVSRNPQKIQNNPNPGIIRNFTLAPDGTYRARREDFTAFRKGAT
jgi:hypothetical protein